MSVKMAAITIGLVLGLSACAATPSSGATSSAGGTLTEPVMSGTCHAGDGGFLPDPNCTPGDTDPRVTQATVAATICRRGYTKTVRPPLAVTAPIKRERMTAYGVSGSASATELDHLLPLELGGASTLRNLWPEPRSGARSARQKDDLENALNAKVCNGSVSLADAHHTITADWEDAYRTYVGTLP